MSSIDAAREPFLQEGGEMGRLMRAMDWRATPLGDPASWPQSLKTAVSLLLRARQPVFIGWGRDYISLYNDGYIPICGTKHPVALGRPMAAVWSEIWPTLAPMNESVMRGESLWFEDMPFELAGRQNPGPSYFSFSYTPLLDDDGRVGGIFCSAVETTSSIMLAERHTEENRRKDEFIATLAHELRNPLAPLRNAVHILRARGAPDPAAQRLHEMMDRQLNHLVRLVDDLLEMSRISRGALELRSEPVPVRQFVEAAREAVEPLVRERRHHLEVDAGADAWVAGDAVRLAQLLSNLLNNAARYTPEGGTIRVNVRPDGDAVAISVRDTGRGFLPGEATRMFELFARGADSPGLGIGLALAQRLAQLHDGTLEAHSDGPGSGATFTLRLPRVAAPAGHTAPTGTAKGTFERIRVMVVDDNHDAADTLDDLLQMLGAQVTVARSGAEALGLFGVTQPDVVLLDIGMPEMDGYEVCRRLRAEHPATTFSIVGLSGWGQERDRQRGREAGFDHHLVKPADLDALRGLLDGISRARRPLP